MMRRTAIAVAAAVLSIAAAGCGSSDGGTGQLGDAIEVAASAPGAATDAGCDLDRATLDAAVEVYLALNGEAPTSEQDLVDAGMIAEPTENWDIDADGEIVASPGSRCA